MHGTVRIIIPHLYGWKGSKWLTKIEFVEEDQPGLFVFSAGGTIMAAPANW
jgi:DMSO/TMAO reductase YedYZ molybdopterin-dependent catalytic subunit